MEAVRTSFVAVLVGVGMILFSSAPSICRADDPAPALVSATSYKPHGTAGTFGIPLSLSDEGTTECRLGGPTQVVLTYDRPIAGSPVVDTLGTGLISWVINGNDLTIDLTGAADETCVALNVSEVASAADPLAIAPARTISIRVLAGDVTDDGQVLGPPYLNPGDPGYETSDLAHIMYGVGIYPLNADTFRCDLDHNGMINIADLAAAMANYGLDAMSCTVGTPVLVSAVSNQQHGDAGTFGIPLSLSNVGTTECRYGGPTHLVLTYDRPIGGNPAVAASNASVLSATINGNNLAIELIGVVDASCMLLEVSGISGAGDPWAIVPPRRILIRVMIGDVTNDGKVQGPQIAGPGDPEYATSDLAQIIYHYGTSPLDADTFKYDLDQDGAIGPNDLNLAWNNYGYEPLICILGEPVPVSAVSNKDHHAGPGSGIYGIPLNLAGAGTSEGRMGGPTQVVLTYDRNITGSPVVVAAYGTSVVDAGADYSELTINLTGTSDSACVELSIDGVTNVHDPLGIAPAHTLIIRALAGDVTNDGLVQGPGDLNPGDLGYETSDVSQIENRMSLVPVGPDTFKYDIDVNGRIETPDVNLVKARVGACPLACVPGVPVLVSAVSNKVHLTPPPPAPPVVFGLPLRLCGEGTSECRTGGPTQVVLTYDRPIGGDPTVTTLGAFVGVITTDGNDLTIDLFGAMDKTCVELTIAGVASATDPTAVVPARTIVIRSLAGDVTDDGLVQGEVVIDPGDPGFETSDISQIKAHMRPGPVDGNTFKYDVAVNGIVNTADVALARANAGQCAMDCVQSVPLLVSAVSNKVHGSAGKFGLPLRLCHPGTSECRTGGPTEVVLAYDRPIGGSPAVIVVGASTTGTSIDEGLLTIGLTGAVDQTCVELTISGVANAADTSIIVPTRTLIIRARLSDVTNDGQIEGPAGLSSGDPGYESSDLSQVETHGGPVSSSRFKYDLDLDGQVNSADVTIATDLLGTCAIECSPGVPLLLSAVSNKPHAGVGMLGLPLSLCGLATSECRANGPTEVVLTYDRPIAGSPVVMAVGAGATGITISVNSLTIGLTGAVDKTCVELTVSGLVSASDPSAIIPGRDIVIRALEGDVTDDGRVLGSADLLPGDLGYDASDVAQIKARSGSPATPSTCRYDFNLSGAVDTTDVTLANTRVALGATLCFYGIPGDYDDDGDVDGDDFAMFKYCFSGPTVTYLAECQEWDFDGDTDVDLGDYGLFQRCYSGVGHPAARDCLD